MNLISVVLSGGAGTRLWPASRQAYPTPFMKLGGSSLLAQAICRGQACGTDEVQCGIYLGEDDIVRLADTYGRA